MPLLVAPAQVFPYMHALLTILFLIPFIFISASKFIKYENLDDKSAIDYCLNCRSLREIEALSFVTSPTHISTSFSPSKPSNFAFIHLRKGNSVPESKLVEANAELDSGNFELCKMFWSISSTETEFTINNNIMSCYYGYYGQAPQEYNPECLLDQNSFYFSPSFYHQVFPQTSCTDSYRLHEVNFTGNPGIIITRILDLNALPSVIKKRGLLNQDLSCFMISESFSTTILIRKTLIGSLYFSFTVDRNPGILFQKIRAFSYILQNYQIYERSILTHYLTFEANKPYFTWNVIISKRFDFIAQELKSQFARYVDPTELDNICY